MDAKKVFVVPQNVERGRADKVLSCIPDLNRSRSTLANLIRAGLIKVNGKDLRPSTVIYPGDEIELTEPDQPQPCGQEESRFQLNIIFENSELLLVDKPAGLVTHPGAGSKQATLMDLVIRKYPEISGVGEEGRWGIVHRLDKDTSGVMVIARTHESHARLSEQFRQHTIHRVYKAIVRGNPKEQEGIIDAPIGRDAKDRKKMTTRPQKGRSAESQWRLVENFKGYALLEIRPKTGRTHQIRAHLASVNLPVLGDKVYGAPTKKQMRSDRDLARLSKIVQRQALHAAELGINIDLDSELRIFYSELPHDMIQALDALRKTD